MAGVTLFFCLANLDLLNQLSTQLPEKENDPMRLLKFVAYQHSSGKFISKGSMV